MTDNNGLVLVSMPLSVLSSLVSPTTIIDAPYDVVPTLSVANPSSIPVAILLPKPQKKKSAKNQWKAKTPLVDADLRRSPRLNIPNDGYMHAQLPNTPIHQRHSTSNNHASSTANSNRGNDHSSINDNNASIVTTPIPVRTIPMMQTMGIGLCDVPPKEVSMVGLLKEDGANVEPTKD